MSSSELTERVRALMAGNRVEAAGGHRYTRPAAGTYPHQWLWDSCFHARIHLALGDREMAADELRALFRAQEQDGLDRGRLPHMTLHAEGAGEQYARDVALWGSPRASSITQPPLCAEVALAIDDRALWRELWDPMCAYYDWWLRRRDPRGDKLLVCHHVWETGADATPRADGAFQRLLATGRRPRALDKGTINLTAKKRPELLAARFLMLEDLQAIDQAEQSGRATTAEADRRRLELYGHVAVEMQAILITNLDVLADIGEQLGELEAARRYRTEAEAIARAVDDRLWDQERGWYVDLWGDPPQPITVMTYAPLMALHSRRIPLARARRLIAHLSDPTSFATRWPVPTLARGEPSFDPDEYWRGSTWLNVNWLVVNAIYNLSLHTGEQPLLDLARALAARSLELVAVSGFREYYRSDGDSPAGFGPEGFSWSGLALNLASLLESGSTATR